MFWKALRLSAAVFLAGAALGAGLARADPQPPIELNIVFPTSPHTFALPHFVAMDKGWLVENGVTVKEQWLTGDTTVIRLVVAGDADLCVTGLPAAFSAIAAGAQLKAIGSQQKLFDFEMVANKSVAKVADLEGKRFAAGPPLSIQTEVPRVVMRKYGLDPSKVEFLQAGGTPERLQAVVSGAADATLIAGAFALQAVARYPNLHVLTTVPKEFPGLGFSYVMASSKEIADPAKRKALETYIEQAVVRASRYIMDHPDEAVKILLKRVPSLDPAIAEQAVAFMNAENMWGVNGGIDPTITDFTVKFSVDSKMIPASVTYAQVVDPSLVDEAIAQFGRR